ncbi:MAG: hypothetical protein ACYSSI_10135, partial [Planctomycetota bacterium]
GKGSQACFLHVENLFRRQRSPRTLQPSAVKGGFGMASTKNLFFQEKMIFLYFTPFYPSIISFVPSHRQTNFSNSHALFIDFSPYLKQKKDG